MCEPQPVLLYSSHSHTTHTHTYNISNKHHLNNIVITMFGILQDIAHHGLVNLSQAISHIQSTAHAVCNTAQHVACTLASATLSASEALLSLTGQVVFNCLVLAVVPRFVGAAVVLHGRRPPGCQTAAFGRSSGASPWLLDFLTNRDTDAGG